MPNGRRGWYYSPAAKEPLSRKHWLSDLEQKVTRHWVVNGPPDAGSNFRQPVDVLPVSDRGLCRGDKYLVVIRKVDIESRERKAEKVSKDVWLKFFLRGVYEYIDKQDKGPTPWETMRQNGANPEDPHYESRKQELGWLVGLFGGTAGEVAICNGHGSLKVK